MRYKVTLNLEAAVALKALYDAGELQAFGIIGYQEVDSDVPRPGDLERKEIEQMRRERKKTRPLAQAKRAKGERQTPICEPEKVKEFLLGPALSVEKIPAGITQMPHNGMVKGVFHTGIMIKLLSGTQVFIRKGELPAPNRLPADQFQVGDQVIIRANGAAL
jgi:hypothetical protein